MDQEPDLEDRSRSWRWIETDPFGHRIYCAKDVWASKSDERRELISHEDAIRSTVRDPDSVFFDPASRTRPRPGGSALATIVHYYSLGRTHGRHAGNYVSVVVKWLSGSPSNGNALARSPGIRGYVQTMYLSGRILPRLQLVWSRVP